MDINTDVILLFLAGMILGGYTYMRVESLVIERKYGNLEGEELINASKKVASMLTFVGVFLFVLTFFLWQKPLPAGIFAGFAIFGIKP